MSANHSHLEQVVYRMSLEQDNLEQRILAIETTVVQLLDRQDSSGQNHALADSCIEIFNRIKGFEHDLTKVIEDLNREVRGRSAKDSEDSDKSLNFAVNNFYNAISAIELQLARIQVTLNSFS